MDPVNTDRMQDPGLERRRRRRRSRLLLLWTLTILLLVLQAGAAVYSTRLRGRGPAAVSPAWVPAPVVGARPAAVADAAPSPDIGHPDGRAVAALPDAAASPDRGRVAAVRRPHRRRRDGGVRRARAEPREPDVTSNDVRVPLEMAGDPAQGERVFRMGCGLCHGRSASKVAPAAMGAKQWSRYFASARHGRHTPLRANFTQAELASVKAYLVSAASGER